eukprot:1455633-Pleurochrysis_carterae.AAC.1
MHVQLTCANKQVGESHARASRRWNPLARVAKALLSRAPSRSRGRRRPRRPRGPRRSPQRAPERAHKLVRACELAGTRTRACTHIRTYKRMRAHACTRALS